MVRLFGHISLLAKLNCDVHKNAVRHMKGASTRVWRRAPGDEGRRMKETDHGQG